MDADPVSKEISVGREATESIADHLAFPRYTRCGEMDEPAAINIKAHGYERQTKSRARWEGRRT